MRLPGGGEERPLRSAGNSSAIATTATSLKAEFLTRIGRWASAVVPPLGSLFGTRLARTCEKAGVSIPVKLQCQRCASVLELGVNCSLRESDKPRAKAIYVCDYCGYRNSKGSGKKKKKNSAPSTSTKPTPDSGRKKKRKGWSSLKDIAAKDQDSPALKKTLMMMDTTTGAGEVVDNGKAKGVEAVDRSGEADFKLSALRKVVDMDARISEVEGESNAPPPAVIITVEDDEPEPEQTQVVSVIMEALPEAADVSPVTVTLAAVDEEAIKAVDEVERTERVEEPEKAENPERTEKAEKPERLVVILDDDVVVEQTTVAENDVETTAKVCIDDERENVPLAEPEQEPFEEAQNMSVDDHRDVNETESAKDQESGKDQEMVAVETENGEDQEMVAEDGGVHEMESGKDQEVVAVEREDHEAGKDQEMVAVDNGGEQGVDVENERVDQHKEPETLDPGGESLVTESKDEEMLDFKVSEPLDDEDVEVRERPLPEAIPELEERSPSNEAEDTGRESSPKKHLRRESTLNGVIRASMYARKIRDARFTRSLSVLRRHYKELDARWLRRLNQATKRASAEKDRADKALEALNAARNSEKTLTQQLSCVPELEKKMDKVSSNVDGLYGSLGEITQELKKQWAAVSMLTASLAQEPKAQPAVHREEQPMLDGEKHQLMLQGEEEQPMVRVEKQPEQLSNVEATTTTLVEDVQPTLTVASYEEVQPNLAVVPGTGNDVERRRRLGVSKLSKRIKKRPFCSPFKGNLALKKTGRRWRLIRLK